MNRSNKQLKTVPVPRRLFESMVEAYRKWEKLTGEFEDFLMTRNKKFVEKMKKARKEHLEGKTKDL